jgi:hypothetical protein
VERRHRPGPSNLCDTISALAFENDEEDSMRGVIRPPASVGPMVVSALSGGLGNQMFQYAAGRSLAFRFGAQLVLDATVFTLPGERRSFALSPYEIDADVIFDGYAHPPPGRTAEYPRGQGWLSGGNGDFVDALRSIVGGICGWGNRRKTLAVFRERSFDYDPQFVQVGPQVYLSGYWQSARYFNQIDELVRGELRLRREPSETNAAWLARVRRTGPVAVCVHIRRGDYLMAAHYDHHGVCSVEYYRRAMQLMRSRVRNAEFFIFSDDWQWCRENLSTDDAVVVDANDVAAVQEELRLMAACRHHIIANSSLSWWAAWLAKSDGQIVIAPKPWFIKRADTPDLFPETWLTLSRDP